MGIRINSFGHAVPESEEVIAWNYVNSEIEIVYQRKPEQIKLLIDQLTKESKIYKRKIDSKYFTEEYWLTTRCAKRNGSCEGSCTDSNKTCQECCNPSCYCCCRV